MRGETSLPAAAPWPAGRVRLGEGVVVVAPLVEALLLRLLRREADAVPPPHPTRLVGRPHVVDSVAYVANGTSVLLLRPGSGLQVLPAGRLVLPNLLAAGTSTYVVLTHDPVEVWLRIGPFPTRDDRLVQQVEVRLTVTLVDSPSSLRDLAEECGDDGPDGLGSLDDALLDRLAREVAAQTAKGVHRRTLAELTGLSLGVLLDQTLPATFLGGLVGQSDLEVVDVDWPTEGRGWLVPATPAPPTPVLAPGPVSR